MNPPSGRKQLRCAIYTRKSTDHNLDLEFNSLDAQREACEAYIKSQAHEGWRLIPARYDDGAFSGASLDRPALRALLAELAADRVDVIVVYKVDRLTRSLADFAKLVELFDRHGVSFVSVTQSFNTTSSMGRLTLNVLLSFAQFEREVIGERVRDKIAASKAKGLWMGGPLPLGYVSIDKKLVLIPEEAQTVRLIFQRYLQLGSIGSLAEDLDRRGIRTRRQTITKGRIRGGIPYSIGPLAYLLRNRLYVGEVVYRGEAYPGEHEPIVDRTLFEAVQAKLAEGAVTRRLKLKSSPSLLMGLIYDDRGNRMTPSHSNKRGVRYRYYVSHALLQKRSPQAGSVSRVSAPDIEQIVLSALQDHIEVGPRVVPDDDRPLDRVATQERNRAGERESLSSTSNANRDRDLIERYIDRVVVRPASVELHLKMLRPIDREASDESSLVEASDFDGPPAPVISVPWTAPQHTSEKGVLHAPTANAISLEARDALLLAIARARGWMDELAGDQSSLAQIAEREGKAERTIRLLAPLAFISPRAITAIADGSVPAGLTVTELARRLPHSWAEQHRLFGLRN